MVFEKGRQSFYPQPNRAFGTGEASRGDEDDPRMVLACGKESLMQASEVGNVVGDNGTA